MSKSRRPAKAIIEGTSPAAWQSVNLFGSFEFAPPLSKIDIAALVARYADPAFWSKILRNEPDGH
jgi:hypothetical protein